MYIIFDNVEEDLILPLVLFPKDNPRETNYRPIGGFNPALCTELHVAILCFILPCRPHRLML